MKGRSIKYDQVELDWIKTHCTLERRKSHARFCKKFARDDVSLQAFNALCKRNGWMTGRTGCYPKGNVPMNKGQKMPFNENSARTQFKSGNLPHNTKYLGHERVSKDGYVEISVDQRNPHTGFNRRYVLKHRYLWEQKNGRLPNGMVLKCLDGNKLNTDPSNWEPMPRATLPYLNGHRGFDYEAAEPEVRPAILTVAKLKHARKRAKSKNMEARHD